MTDNRALWELVESLRESANVDWATWKNKDWAEWIRDYAKGSAVGKRHAADELAAILSRAAPIQTVAGGAFNYKDMFESAVVALAEIDRLLDLPEDGCNDPQVTVSALADFIAGHKDMQKYRDEWVDAQYAASAKYSSENVAILERPVVVGDDEVRLWDTQWMNIVNHDNCYRDWSKDDAIAHAVKMTEESIARNVADGKLPPRKDALESMVRGES